MYSLTLSKSERLAIDFVGRRYPEGHDFYKLLCCAGRSPVDADWDDPREITFTMPEHLAWEVRDLLDAKGCNYGAALFANEFRNKLIEFCEYIV